MYESNSAKILKIGITGNADDITQKSFHDLLNDTVLESIKVFQNFSLQTDIITETNNSYQNYNFIFYVTSLTNMITKSTEINNAMITDIQKISQTLANPRNHLFIIIDGCENMTIDDDGDLTLSDKRENTLYQKFDGKISDLIADNLFHCCKISIAMSQIWRTISEDNSIVNLSEQQIDQLAVILLDKSGKMSIADKKRNIRTELKKIDINDKVAAAGYSEFYDTVIQYFKIIYQKKLICQNYLYAVNNIIIGLKKSDMDNINDLIKEIYTISYLKTDIHDDLIDKVDSILLIKLKTFYEKNKNNISTESNTNFKSRNTIDIHEYHNFLSQIILMANSYNISTIKEETNIEMNRINDIIIEYHNKEIEKITDLEKIGNFLEIFATKDKNNLYALFEKIKSHPKIMTDNINKMDKWIIFINKCLKLGITQDFVIKLMEEIIMAKIAYYLNTNNTINSTDISIVYPQCLHVFLLLNLKHFVFKRLYMFISYSIRYSGRNISELIKNIKAEQYENMLILENKLLELCTSSTDEQSQPINLSDVEIVETFNDVKSKSEPKNKIDTSNTE